MAFVSGLTEAEAAEAESGRPPLETSELLRTADPSPLFCLMGFERVWRTGPPREFEVLRIVVMVVVDIGRVAYRGGR